MTLKKLREKKHDLGGKIFLPVIGLSIQFASGRWKTFLHRHNSKRHLNPPPTPVKRVPPCTEHVVYVLSRSKVNKMLNSNVRVVVGVEITGA